MAESVCTECIVLYASVVYCAHLGNLAQLHLSGEQGWCSGESTRLPAMCPGFNSWTQRYMWVEFVVGSLLCLLREVFLRVLRFSPLLKNQHFQIQICSWNARALRMSSCELLGAPWVKKLHIYIFKTMNHGDQIWITCCRSTQKRHN